MSDNVFHFLSRAFWIYIAVEIPQTLYWGSATKCDRTNGDDKSSGFHLDIAKGSTPDYMNTVRKWEDQFRNVQLQIQYFIVRLLSQRLNSYLCSSPSTCVAQTIFQFQLAHTWISVVEAGHSNRKIRSKSHSFGWENNSNSTNVHRNHVFPAFFALLKRSLSHFPWFQPLFRPLLLSSAINPFQAKFVCRSWQTHFAFSIYSVIVQSKQY